MACYEDIIVSGSYDSEARIWSIKGTDSSKLLKRHNGGQIYSIAFNGKRIATGSLDAQDLDPKSGYFISFLARHAL